MTFTIDQLFAAAEQELAAWKGEGEKLHTDFDYEKLGFLRAVAERLPSVSKNSGKPIVSGSLPLCCMDCGRRYDAFGLDVVLPNEQWKLIHPDEQGVLCAQCIVNRADKMGAIVALMTIDFGGNGG